MKDNQHTEGWERIKDFIVKHDWRGLAESWHKGEMEWHAEEWKKFIEHIRKEERERLAGEFRKFEGRPIHYLDAISLLNNKKEK